MAKKAKKSKADSTKVWTIFSFVAALGRCRGRQEGDRHGWKAATGKKPPANPADPDVDLREAVIWAVASGTFVALMRMLATRRAANYYAKSTGHLPAPLRKDEPS